MKIKTLLFFIILFQKTFLLLSFNTLESEKRLLLNFYINDISCEIKQYDKIYKIITKFPYETDLSNLIAKYETVEDVKVYVNNIEQTNGITPNDFSKSTTYVLINNEGTEQHYKVDIIFKPEFKMNLSASFHPSYNFNYNMLNLGINGYLYLGVKLNKMILQANVLDNFFIFNGKYNNKNLSGYWNILNGAFINQIILNKYINIKWGIGAGWIYSTFIFENIILYERNNPGIFIEFDLFFNIWKYIRLDLINQFNLFINISNGNPFQNLENFYPYYIGGARLNFCNFIKWFGIYFELAGLYSYYKKENIDTTTGIFIFNTGLFIDLQFPSLIRNYEKNKKYHERKFNFKYGIEGLKKAKINDEIEFPDLVFKKDSNELTEKSINNLSKIAALLLEKTSMQISIKLFSKKDLDPVILLSSIIEKAKIIKNHLIKFGISEDRIHIPSEVFLFQNENETRSLLVKIKVLKE